VADTARALRVDFPGHRLCRTGRHDAQILHHRASCRATHDRLRRTPVELSRDRWRWLPRDIRLMKSLYQPALVCGVLQTLTAPMAGFLAMNGAAGG
jgi:hypothetical protein